MGAVSGTEMKMSCVENRYVKETEQEPAYKKQSDGSGISSFVRDVACESGSDKCMCTDKELIAPKHTQMIEKQFLTINKKNMTHNVQNVIQIV